MTDRGAFLGMTWQSMRSLGATRARDGRSAAMLARTDEHAVETSWWPRGSSNTIHGHGGSTASVLVLEGELVEERWSRGDDGAWLYARRILRAGDRADLAPGSLHRMVALRDASVMTTYSPPPNGTAEPVDPRILAMLEIARGGVDPAASTAVGLWAPRPEDVANSDA